MKTEFSPQAQDDLDAIVLYIARDDPDAALAWADKLIDRAERAAQAPRGGRIVPEWGDPDIREVFLKTYRIIYRVEADRILVLTVFEGRHLLRMQPPSR